MRKIALTAIGFALFTAVANTSLASAQNAPQPATENTNPVIVVVQPGDTLISIAGGHDTTYVRLFNANGSIVDPDKIAPGDQIRIPDNNEQLPERALPSVTPEQPAAPAPSPKEAAPAPASADDGVWDKIALCESNGNWSINTGNGYYGGLQFTLSSWKAVGGDGMPHEASREEQIARGKMLQSKQGWKAWPVCSKKAGML